MSEHEPADWDWPITPPTSDFYGEDDTYDPDDEGIHTTYAVACVILVLFGMMVGIIVFMGIIFHSALR